MEETNLTYESLFELVRNEKNKSELQELPKNTYNSILNYLKKKNDFLEQGIKNNTLSEKESEKIQIQLKEINSLLKKFFNKREKKIIVLAINKARTDSDLMDTESLFPEEKHLYMILSKVLSRFRKDVIKNIQTFQEPNYLLKEITNGSKLNKESYMVRFIDYVPKFVGPNEENYGPFEPEDMAKLPTIIVKILQDKKKAEIINKK